MLIFKRYHLCLLTLKGNYVKMGLTIKAITGKEITEGGKAYV